MTGKYESYFESFRSLTESEFLLRVISVKPKFHPKMCHWNERGREPEEGGKRRFHFSCTHSKNSSHSQWFFHSTSRVILIHCVVESFRKTGSFSVIESKHSPAEKRVSNWINFTGRLKWLGNVLHGKSMTETFESLSSVMRQSFESLSVIQSFFHPYYRIKFLSHCKMLQSFWFGPSHWVIFTPLRQSHWSSDWNCECDPNHWLQCLAEIVTGATSQTGQNTIFF